MVFNANFYYPKGYKSNLPPRIIHDNPVFVQEDKKQARQKRIYGVYAD